MVLTHLILFRFWTGGSNTVTKPGFGGTISPMGFFALMPNFSGSTQKKDTSARIRPFIANVNIGMNR